MGLILDLIRSPQINVNPDSPAIITSDKIITYNDLDSLIKKGSLTFDEMGIKKNDIVALLFENSVDFIIAVLSLWKIGAIAVPLNIKLLEKDLNEQIDFLKPKLILIEQKFKDVFHSGNISIFSSDNIYHNGKEVFLKKLSKDKTALILFTSGSSGKPKAVMLSFDNLIQSALIGNKVLNHTTEDKWMASLPFYHIGGFSIIFRALLFGAAIIIPDSLSNQDLSDSIKKNRPTLVSLVSNQLKKIIDEDFTPPKELRTVLLGGGFSDKELILKAIEKGWKIAKVYSSTETSSFVSFINSEEVKRKPDASGKAVSPNKIIITEEGEIAVKSPAIMQGYFQNEIESSLKLKDGFYFTGDTGYIDEEGYLFVEAKRDDLIISGGENINPVEVENAILSNQKVKEACVVGISDKQWGQALTAVIVLNENNFLNEKELKDYLKIKLAPFKVPKRIFFVKFLPKSALGKVQRDEVKKLIKAVLEINL